MPEEFKNSGLFLRFGLPSTSICHENGDFRESFFNWRYLKTPSFYFRVDGTEHFENEVFRKRRRVTIII